MNFLDLIFDGRSCYRRIHRPSSLDPRENDPVNICLMDGKVGEAEAAKNTSQIASKFSPHFHSVFNAYLAKLTVHSFKAVFP